MLQKSFLRHLLILALYCFVALLLIGRNPLLLFENFIGSETGDTYEMARNIWWYTYAIRNGEPLFYQTFLGYPDGIDGSVLISVPLQYFPMWLLAFVLPLPIAYNSVVILWMTLNGYAFFHLVRYLLDDENYVPAFIAGLVYMAHPIFQAHLLEGHAGLVLGWTASLYLWALLKFIKADKGAWRWLLTSIGLFYLSTTGHILQSIYVLLPVTGTLTLWRLWVQDWRGVRRIVAMGFIASSVTLLALIPAIQSATTETAYTDTDGTIRYSTDLLSIVSPSFLHPLFGDILDYPARVLGINLVEGAAYIGVIAGGLALAGFFTHKQARWWGMLAVVAWILSLGSVLKIYDQPIMFTVGTIETAIPLPFALLQQLPAFNLARTPGRFTFSLAIALAVLVGYGARWLWQRRAGRWRYAIALLLASGIVYEYLIIDGMPLRPAAIPQAVSEIANRDDVRAVFNVPHQHLLAAKDALYLQTAHEKPIIAGQITRQTPVDPAKLNLLQDTLDPMLLNDAGIDRVIYHRARAAEIGLEGTLDARFAAQLGEPIFADERIAVYAVPTVDMELVPLVSDISGTSDNRITLNSYLPDATWLDIAGTFTADNRTVELHIDNRLVHRWQVQSEQAMTVPVYIPQSDYVAVALSLVPPCPAVLPNHLHCDELDYAMQTRATPLRDATTALFDDGITLNAGDVRLNDETIAVRLHWQFGAPRSTNDVRFVHLVNSAGELVAQNDIPLGQFTEGDEWAEFVTFPLDVLAAGRYRVRVGWYNLVGDTLSNYTSNGQGAVTLGTVTIATDE